MLGALLVTLLAPSSSLLTFDMEEARARPVTKVLTLLQGMKEQLESEANEEEELMEKYKCWCKENGDEKATSVEAAEAKIKEMEAKVSQLSADSARLAVEYKNLGKDVEKNEASMDEVIALRKKQLAKFREHESDLLKNLQSVKSANDVIEGGTSFVQLSQQTAISQTLQKILARHAGDLSSENGRQVAMLLQDPSTGNVEGVLQGLKEDFQRSLHELQTDENINKAEYEKLLAAKREEIDAAKVQIEAKKEQKTAADAERMQLKQNIKDSRASMGEDIAFAKEVKEKCGVKAKEWEKRQKTRADETESVTKAIQVLSDDSAHEVFGKTFSFLQMSSSSTARREKAAHVLSKAGVKDARLMTLAMEAKLDGFTIVKEKIDAMVGALKEEQAAEVKQKDYCIAEFQKNKLATTKKQRLATFLGAKNEEVKMKMQTASDDLAELETDIQELQKQQALASQNREKENTEFQKVVAEQRATQEFLKKALSVLGDFYNKQQESFVQQDASPKEPKTFGSYQKSSSSNGVMLMLQKLIADAKAMETEATAAEAESQGDYEAFGKDTTKTLEKKAKSIADKEETKAKAAEQLLETKKSQKGAKEDLQDLESTAMALHETCDWTLQNFDARQKARSEEVDALNEAKSYLSGAKL